MSSYLADVNIWLALLVHEHEHHDATLHWFRSVAAGDVALCRLVQLSTIRLMGNADATRGKTVPALQAWAAFQHLCNDERVEFLNEPEGLDAILPTLFRYRVPTPGLVNDAYLAAFAMASRRCLVTYDRGFQQFRGLEVEIMGD